MNTRDYVNGYATGFNDGLKYGGATGGGDEDWTPPADWPIVPEPKEYEVCLLVDISDVSTSSGKQLKVLLTDPTTANTGCGPIVYDWGDGAIDLFADSEWGNYIYHEYESVGKYVVKISATETSCFLQQTTPTDNYSKILIAKLGDEIILNNDEIGGHASHTQAAFTYQYKLQYIKFGGKGGLARYRPFCNDYSLQKIDIAIPPKIIPSYSFTGCYNLKSFDLSEITQVANYGIYDTGFKKIYMPKCKSIGERGFYQNEILTEINLPLCESIGKSGIYGNPALTSITLPVCSDVGESGLGNLKSLEKLELPQCISAGQNCFCDDHELKSVEMPLCTSLGETAMSNCYSLRSITVAEDCVFGTNCFQNCYRLIPHPDGTT